jgi:hypothetical protein
LFQCQYGPVFRCRFPLHVSEGRDIFSFQDNLNCWLKNTNSEGDAQIILELLLNKLSTI